MPVIQNNKLLTEAEADLAFATFKCANPVVELLAIDVQVTRDRVVVERNTLLGCDPDLQVTGGLRRVGKVLNLEGTQSM